MCRHPRTKKLLGVSRVCASLSVGLTIATVLSLIGFLAINLFATPSSWPVSLHLVIVLLWPCLAFAGLISAVVGWFSWSAPWQTRYILSFSLSCALSMLAALVFFIPVMTLIGGP